MVRAMAQQVADAGGNEVPSGNVSFGDLQRFGSGAEPRGGRVPSVWRTLGEPFRRRDEEIHRRAREAYEQISERIQALKPDWSPREVAYESAQVLFDYLSGKEPLNDRQLAERIASLRAEIPSVDSTKFRALPQLKKGAEAQVHHDAEGLVVYKLFRVKDGETGAYVPGQMRMANDGQIRIVAGPRPTFSELLGRMARTNAAGDLTPTEFAAITPDGYAVFVQPFITGRSADEKEAALALARVGLKVITQMGGTAAIGEVNEKPVLFDDLHGRNVKIAPNGNVEVIDALNRQLIPEELKNLRDWQLLPG